MSDSITSIAKNVSIGEKTARSYVEEALERIHNLNHEYNAVISTLEPRALELADEVDQKVAEGQMVGRLAGVPYIAKDNFLVTNGKTTAASNMLRDFEAPYQATAIERLEAEGAICIAKANLDAFAHGGSTENSDFGPTKNPHDTGSVPGGSSGGSAAAVALDIVPFALGTDTGGSIRQPASFCGVYGLKPTYGLVSRYGVVAMASSTDCIGPIARSAEDVALVLDILAGHDERDGTTHPERKESYLVKPIKTSLKIGLISEYMDDNVDSRVVQTINQTAESLRGLGHSVENVSLSTLPLGLAVYYIVVPAEISSNLARYDGIKYGYSAQEARSLEEVYGLSRENGFNPENKRRILIGNYVLSSGYYDAYYRKAQTVRTMIINDFNKAFENYDILLGPVAPTPAFKLGENAHDPMQMYLADIMTVSASLAGVPAISVPVGESESGLPIGAQLIAPQNSDDLLLSVAAQLGGKINE